MKMDEFLQQHAVFTVEELDRFLSERGSGNPNTRRSLLTYYRKKGRIIPDPGRGGRLPFCLGVSRQGILGPHKAALCIGKQIRAADLPGP